MRTFVNLAAAVAITLGLIFVVRGLASYIFDKPAVPVPAAMKQEPPKSAAAKPAGKPAVKQAAASQPSAQPAAKQAAATPAAAGAGDPAKGKKVFNKCKACHFADKPKNKVGPSLLGVVGRPVAAFEGYKYSEAMKAKAADIGTWTEDKLKAFLAAPKAVVPGTKMTFAGLKKEQDILNVIAYLKSFQQ